MRELFCSLCFRATVGVLLLNLTGCHPEVEVNLASKHEPASSFAFTVTDGDGGPTRCSSVEVFAWDKQKTSHDALWEISKISLADKNAPTSMRYGITPSGWTSRKKAEPLRPGTVYVLYASGPGHGGFKFEINPQGIVVQCKSLSDDRCIAV